MEWCMSIPKVELHAHLNGSIRDSTLLYVSNLLLFRPRFPTLSILLLIFFFFPANLLKVWVIRVSLISPKSSMLSSKVCISLPFSLFYRFFYSISHDYSKFRDQHFFLLQIKWPVFITSIYQREIRQPMQWRLEKVLEYHIRWFKHVCKRFVEAAVRIVVQMGTIQ